MANGNGGDVSAEVLNLGQGWFLKLSRLLAEGGFSYVYLGEDSSPTSQHQGAQSQLYAVKRMNVSTNLQKKSALAEVDLIKQFNHPNIIQCITTHSTVRKHSPTSSTEFFYLVMEYCCPLPKTLKNEPLVGNIFKQCIEAVEYCHSFGLSHRDIKLENFMVGPDGYVKLIDFGSASTDIIKPEIDWSSKQRCIVEEELATVTTPMYRAPEIVSLWENYIIDSRVDTWALGCTLYLMWFGNHPFPDSNKLAILNGKYTLVEEEICPNFKKIISGLLQVNPEDRLSFSDIKRLLVDYQVVKLEYCRPVFEDPIVPPNLMNNFPQQAASSTKSLFSSLKVGAESLFKNIRDNYYNPAAPGQGQGQRPAGPPQQAPRPANRHVESDSLHGPAPPLPPKHPHQTSYDEDERVSSVLSSRPPQPPSPKPPRPPKPSQANSANEEPTNVMSQPVVVDNLLNFGDDMPQNNQTRIGGTREVPRKESLTKKGTEADLLSDLFSSNVTMSAASMQDSVNVPSSSTDLFGNMQNGSISSHQNSFKNPNVDLLEDLFGSGPSVVVGQEPIPPTAGTANQTNTMPTSSSFTSLFLGGNLKPDELKKNVSSPNLTQLLGNGNSQGGGGVFSGFEFDLDLGSKPSSVNLPPAAAANVNMQGPNYSRSLFDDKPAAAAPPPRQDLNAVFGEFLNDVGFTTSNKPTTQTMGELRMESNTKDLDPITINIRKWTKDGQNRKNIRALLSTLHTVTWPACTWEEHPMSQMIQPVQVKKVYRKACLCVHPDKQVGTEWETLAKSIFIELNEAWSYFSQEEQM